MRRLLFSLLVGGCLIAQNADAQVATIVESNTEFECTGAKTATLHERRVIVIHNAHGDDLSRLINF